MILAVAAAGVLAQPAVESNHAHGSLVEQLKRAAPKRSGEKKNEKRKETGRKPASGAAGSGLIAVLSPDCGAGKAGGGFLKISGVPCPVADWEAPVRRADRSAVAVGDDVRRGRLHRPTHFALAPPRA